MRQQQYLFAFEDGPSARTFVKRLLLALGDLAIYIDDCHVIVIDGGEFDRRERILQLARSSSARHAVM